MNKKIGKWRSEPNNMYNLQSIAAKIALGVLENGLMIDDNKNLTYNPENGKGWVAKLSRELKISKAAIIKNLDNLFDYRILSQPLTEVLELVDDENTKKYVRTFSITNEYQEQFIEIYKLTHNLTKE
jgi:hypothetical protein